MSVGSTISTPDASALGQIAAYDVELVVLEQALADLVSLGLEEREHHAAADQQPVGLAEQVVDHAELVRDLRAAEHDGIRSLRLLGQPAEHLDLGEHELPGRVRQSLRDVVDAGLLAVHDAEAVAHERVTERRQLVGERTTFGLVLAGLPALNRTFSSSTTSPSLIASTADVAASPTVSLAMRHLDPEQVAETLRYRRQRVRRVGLAAWAGPGGP